MRSKDVDNVDTILTVDMERNVAIDFQRNKLAAEKIVLDCIVTVHGHVVALKNVAVIMCVLIARSRVVEIMTSVGGDNLVVTKKRYREILFVVPLALELDVKLTQIVLVVNVAMTRSVLNVLAFNAFPILSVALDIVVNDGIITTKVGV